jgi:hypothetical protein
MSSNSGEVGGSEVSERERQSGVAEGGSRSLRAGGTFKLPESVCVSS